MGNRSARAIVVGAGIGGMVTALCLARQGWEVRVLEQASNHEVIGAGIQLSPNCTRVLLDLGLESALRARSFVPAATEFRHWRTGRVIASNLLGRIAAERYGAPYFHILRADLMAVLAEATASAPGIEIVFDQRVTGLDQDASQVDVLAGEEGHTADIVVGADGIHSSVRQALFGADQPRFTGHVAWRALVPVDRLSMDLIRPMATAWWGPGRHFVHYYVKGGELVNCVGVVEKQGAQVESWLTRGDVSELAADFSGWNEVVQTLISETDPGQCFKTALYDRYALLRWTLGRATLLGDACHPTLPFMAQGAAMAIEDAAVLAQCLEDGPSTEALALYEQLRRERTRRVQTLSRRNGRIYHMSGPVAFFRDLAAPYASNHAVHWLYAHDVLRQSRA